MLKYIVLVMEDALNKYKYIPKIFNISLHLHVYETHILLYEWVRNNLITVNLFLLVAFPALR